MSEFPPSVEAQVAFIREEWRASTEQPRIYSRDSRQAVTSWRNVVIHNARIRHNAGDLDLDQSGFMLVNHVSGVENFGDKNVVLSKYFDEMRDLIISLTGAHDAIAFPFYQVRSKDPEHFFDAYSLYMHCDYSLDTASQFAQSIIRHSGRNISYPAEHWDFALYNLWRPVGGEVHKDPLVVTDASTVERTDIINYQAVQAGNKGQAAMPLFNKNQQYYYVPHMQTDEVLIFKQLDSRHPNAQVCPHTSFVDPTASTDARERQSIDIRFMCVFPK